MQQRHHHPQSALHPVLALLAAVFCLWGCGSSGGGDAEAGGSPELGAIRVYNHSSHAGAGVADVVIPLSKGFYPDVPGVRTADGKVCQVHGMGARFEDGSLRYLRVEVPVETEADELQTVELAVSSPQTSGFVKHPAISGLTGVDARLRVAGLTVDFPSPQRIEAGPVSETYRSRVRAGTSMVWAELTVTLYSDLPHARFTLQWGNSDPSQPQLQTDPGEVEVQFRGATVYYEIASKVLARSDKSGFDAATLYWGGMMGDGQSNFLEGQFVYTGSQPPRLYAISQLWGQKRVFGPFGSVMPEVGVDEAEFLQQAQSDLGRHHDDPWERCVHGCNPDPSNTGSQADFGTIVMRADLVLGDPRRLPSIKRSIYQEACRSTHVREMDGSMVTIENHPNLLTQSGRAKHVDSKSDLLGKSQGWISNYKHSPDGHRWVGHDFEHLSINYVSAYALVTGNRFAREEVEHHRTLYLSGYTYKSGSPNDSLTPSRKFGRSTMAALWIWLVTGNEAVAERAANRSKALKEQLDEVRPAHIAAIPTFAPRYAKNRECWFAWEEGCAVTSLAAVYHNFGTPEAKEIAMRVGKSLTMHAFARHSIGQWRVAYQCPYTFPDNSVYVGTQDPNFDAEAAGGGITMWASPALVFVALEHSDGGVRNRAREILSDLYGNPVDGMGEELEWLAAGRKAVDLLGVE